MRSFTLSQSKSLHHNYREHITENSVLQKRLLLFSFFNLFLVSLIGVWLRLFPVLPPSVLLYKNILHGHSHFALGGWVTPVVVALLLKSFPFLTQAVAYKHWRNIGIMILSSAYGMLASFPVQGYGPVSIFFSTLSVAAGFYLAFVVWRALKNTTSTTAHLFLKWSLVYLVVSAAGPFAVGFLGATGKGGTPLYFDAVYYYLHFQYNGFFTFAVLAIFFSCFCKETNPRQSLKVFWLLNLACIPTFFLSVLWHEPGTLFNLIGGAAAVLQLAALFYLWPHVKNARANNKWIQGLLRLSMLAFAVKALLQVGNAVPSLALFAYHYRSVTIAYLHLVLLGFVSVFCIAATFQAFGLRACSGFKKGILFFIPAFVGTELLLVLPAVGGVFHFSFPAVAVQYSLIGCSVLLPIGILRILLAVYAHKKELQ